MLHEGHDNFFRKTVFSTPSLHLTCCRPGRQNRPNLDYHHVCGDNWRDGSKINLRTIEAQIVQKLKNNEARPNFTDSCNVCMCTDACNIADSVVPVQLLNSVNVFGAEVYGQENITDIMCSLGMEQLNLFLQIRSKQFQVLY